MARTRNDIGGARTPEELATLLEDSLIVGDAEALASLFEAGATLVAGNAQPARGREAIARVALAVWGGDLPYVADLRHVVVARDVALILTGQGIHVARRAPDGAWRYTIVLQRVGGPQWRGGKYLWIGIARPSRLGLRRGRHFGA